MTWSVLPGSECGDGGALDGESGLVGNNIFVQLRGDRAVGKVMHKVDLVFTHNNWFGGNAPPPALGSGPGGLVLAGHSDTVPFDAALWHSDPLRLTAQGDRWVGLGVCDMKGFFPLVIEALRELLDQPFRQPLLVLATCDEESSMAGARALAAAGRPLGRAAVIGEPTGLKPIRLHKGVMMERIDILGQSGHSSDPSLGHSALEAMQDVMGELRLLRAQWQREFNNPQFGVPQPTLNFGCIHGGDNPNRICGQCALEFDLRPLPGMDPEQLRAAIRGKLQQRSVDSSVC